MDASPKKTAAPASASGRKRSLFGTPGELNSLFGEILDWMLAPLLFLWPISIAVTNHVANQIADQPYDQALSENVAAIVRLVKIEGGHVSLNFPASARSMLRADEVDTLYYQVTGLRGELIAGDREIPWVDPPEKEVGTDDILFRDDSINGEEIRVAYAFLSSSAGRMPVLVQVAETRNKRGNLSSRIISGVLLPQFAIIPLAVVLVYLGLSRGIAPLNRLQARIRGRRPGDLSPIPIRGVPEELRPVIVALNEMMQRLEENLQAQQRFIADAAHQLKTPLTGLKMQTELALQETDPAQLHEFVARIASGTDRAVHLATQLLVLARAEASHEKVHSVEPLDLEVLAKQVTEEWVMRAMAAGIDLGFEGTGWPLAIDGIPLLLRELVKNLIDNAIKYTPRGGKVTVRARAGIQAVLEIEDNGIGIPASDRELVFERFYRVLGTDADGSGLGLPIVKEIADLHRATVSLLVPEGKQGTLVRIAFPRREGLLRGPRASD
jgi:two-component system sensor histidine kinase TctE